jgi:hypothetical protein
VPAGSNEQETLKLYNALLPRLRKIELALRCDPDLFPDRTLYPEFDTTQLMRTDAKTAGRGRALAGSGRDALAGRGTCPRGMGPLPAIPDDPTQEPGKVPQLTPVGGSPNPNADSLNP